MAFNLKLDVQTGGALAVNAYIHEADGVSWAFENSDELQ